MSWVGSTDNTGAVRVNVVAGGGGGGGGGNVVITNPLPLPVTVGNFPVVAPITGTVAVSNFPVTQPVSGTFFQATQPVSGTVAVSNLPATQPVSGTVGVNNFPATQAVTGTFFQATQPISGTVAVSNFPATQAVTIPTPVPVTDDGGSLTVDGTVAVSNFPAVVSTTFAPPLLDGVAHLRTSNLKTLYSLNFQYDLQPLTVQASFSGTTIAPVYDAFTASAILSTSAGGGNGDTSLETYTSIPYQPFKSLLIKMAFQFSAAVANVDKQIGYMDNQNGFYFEQTGITSYGFWWQRTTAGGIPSFTQFAPAQWNIDKVNGLGGVQNPSGLLLSFTEAIVAVIEISYSQIRFGFEIRGAIVYVHSLNTISPNLNNIGSFNLASQQLALPIRARIRSNVNSVVTTMRIKSIVVFCESGFDRPPDRTISTRNVAVTAPLNARIHVFSIRPLLTFKGVLNRMTAFLRELNMVVLGSNPVFYEFGIGATFSAAPAFTQIDAESGFEVGTGGTLTALPYVLESGYIATTTQSRSAITSALKFLNLITLNQAGAVHALGTVTLVATGLVGPGGSDMAASMDFEEYR